MMLSVKLFQICHTWQKSLSLNSQCYGSYTVAKAKVSSVTWRCLPRGSTQQQRACFSVFTPCHDGSHSFPERAAARAPPPPD